MQYRENDSSQVYRYEQRKRADELFCKQRYRELVPVLVELIDSPDAPLDDQYFRLYRGWLYEIGFFGTVDNVAAFDEFKSVFGIFDDADALQGMARTALKLDESQALIALEMYEQSLKKRGDAQIAFLCIGSIYENQLNDFSAALRNYLLSFLRGRADALMAYANLQERRGRSGSSSVARLIYLIARTPILKWLDFRNRKSKYPLRIAVRKQLELSKARIAK